MATVLSTDYVKPAERAGYWSDIIWRSFGKLRSDTWGDERFSGHISQVELGEIRASRLAASRHRVVRTAGARGASDPGYLKLVVQHEGHSLFEQEGRRALLEPGTWSIYDTTRSYTVSTPDDVKLDVLLLPREAILGGNPGLERLFVRRLPARVGTSRLACDAIRNAVESPDGMPRADSADAILRLVRLALLEQAGETKPLAARWILRDRIKAHVATRLADPGLDSDSIAQALRCSKRTLHKAFEDDPCTLHQHIWVQRLEGTRAELEDPRSARSISEVAFAWGFNSPEHFSRVFRARYGASPREWRLSRRSSRQPARAGAKRESVR